jgi:hypothetical protein
MLGPALPRNPEKTKSRKDEIPKRRKWDEIPKRRNPEKTKYRKDEIPKRRNPEKGKKGRNLENF